MNAVSDMGARADRPVSRVCVAWGTRTVDIEYQWLNTPAVEGAADGAPLMVFLHEGLGSLALWRDFPSVLCARLGCRGLVYSRPGYGQSTPRAADDHWAPDFMHQQADQVLPALLGALRINPAQTPLWLLGHSDGGSIALLYAAHHPQQVAGLVVLAPHTMVEPITLQSIAEARTRYLETDLRQRLARYHRDPDSAFWGWNTVWLHPAFATWDIRPELPAIACPLLAVQGLDDAYGTLAQIRAIARQVPHTQLCELPSCGHTPHTDQAATLQAAIHDFFHQHQQQCQETPACNTP